VKLVAVVTTVAMRDDADRLARAAVDARLAACVQMQAIDSVYRWEGAVEHEPEVRLLFKTTADARGALERLISAMHPYDLPAIWSFAVDEADPRYAAWVGDSVAAP
jgi:periplasmic divalent cation tolerance protein